MMRKGSEKQVSWKRHGDRHTGPYLMTEDHRFHIRETGGLAMLWDRQTKQRTAHPSVEHAKRKAEQLLIDTPNW